MYQYDINSLIDDFPQLISSKNLELCNILDHIFHEWIKKIPNSIVSDIQKLEEENDHFLNRYSNYICVVEGKIVNLDISGYNILCDGDERDYKVDSISFNRHEIENKKSRYNLYHNPSDFPNKEDEIKCKKLFESFSNFVKNQKLEGLV